MTDDQEQKVNELTAANERLLNRLSLALSGTKMSRVDNAEQAEAEISRLLNVQADLEAARDRAVEEVISISSELRIQRIENKRLLNLIQEQDKTLRASDAAQEASLADRLAASLAETLRETFDGMSIGRRREALADYYDRREAEAENTSEWDKRVS